MLGIIRTLFGRSADSPSRKALDRNLSQAVNHMATDQKLRTAEPTGRSNLPRQDTSASLRRRYADELPAAFDSDTPALARLAEQVRHRPKLFAVLYLFTKARTKVAFIVAAWCIAEGIYSRERPHNLLAWDVWVTIGALLITAGLVLRFGALGHLKKDRCLATEGVYSLCRHPLYLGSILLAYGFCTLLADAENFILVTIYLLVFYPVTIAWEETSLADRFGDDHRQYRERTPVLLPLGAFRAGTFHWKKAFSAGGWVLLLVVVLGLVGIQALAETM